ncbi:MAG: ribosomal protein S18-alanine N-acetyltransferase [Petrotogales bacterium]
MFEIRQVQPKDIFSVIKMAYETLPERYNPVIFNTVYETFPEGFLVAEKLHKIVGFIIGINMSKERVRILMLSVNKAYRRQGIGSALVKQLLEEMLLKNIQQVDLEVKTNNKAAINFYKKHGFNIIETVANFYQTGEDAHIMRRVLHSS